MHLNMIIHLVNPLELKNGANNTINNIYTYKQNKRMKLLNLIPLHEIDFPTQTAFDTYSKAHKLRPDTKVKIAGKNTTAGQASQVKGTSVFGNKTTKVTTPKSNVSKYDASGETDYFEEYEQLPDNIKDLMDKHFGSGDDEYDYKELESIQKDFEANGWTFDFDLSGTPFELKPLPQSAPKADTPKASNDKGDSGFGWGPETDRKKATGLPKKASQLNYKHAEVLEKALNAEAGLDGYVDTDDNTDAIMFHGTNTISPTYTIYFGGNDDYGKPDEFRVSLLSTYGNDPSNIGDSVDKTFKSGEDAMKFMIAVAKKYKKELEMTDDDDDTNESTKLTSMIKK